MARKKKNEDETYMPMGDENASKRVPSEDESKWSKRLSQSKAFQKRYSGEWDENKRLIFNSSDPGDKQGSLPAWMGGSENSIAYGWGLYEGLETTIYVQNPEIICSARDAMLMPVAKMVTNIVRYDIDQMDVKSVGNMLLLDSFICGYGALIEDARTYKEKYENEKGEEDERVTEQEFEVRRIDPKDILFDRNARKLDLSDSNYLFVAWYPTVNQLRDDPEITDFPEDIIDQAPECSENIRSVAPAEGPVERQAATAARGGTTGEKDPAFKTVLVWEIFDKVNKKKLYMLDFKHRIIGEGKWPVDLKYGCRDMFPVTIMFQHPVPGRFYPMPEGTLIAPQLREINVVERMISEDTRTKWRKYLTLAGILTEDQKAQVTDTTIANALIYVDASKLTDVLGIQGQPDIGSIDLRQLVVPMEDVAPKKDLFQRYDMLEKEIQHIVGYGPSARGGMPSTRSAREAMMVNAQQERKLDKRKSRINDFYRLIAMKHVRYLQKYMSVERYAKIFPKAEDLRQWFSYTREDVQGDFEFDVITGTTTPKNTETKKASELQLFQAIAPIIQQTGGDMRPAFMRLADFYDWDGVDALFGGMDQKAEQGAMAIAGFGKGKVPPEALVNAFSQLVLAVLGPAKLKLLAEKMQGGGGQQQGAGKPKGQRGDSAPLRTAQGVP